MSSALAPSSPFLRAQHQRSGEGSLRIASGVLASSSSSSSNRCGMFTTIRPQNGFSSLNEERVSFKAHASTSSKRLRVHTATQKRVSRDVSVYARGWRFWRKKKKDDEDSPWWLMDEKAMKRFTDEGKESVFRLRTTNLPGMSEDKMTPEGAAAGALVLGLAVWSFVIVVKLLALAWGSLYAGVKYAAIAAVLVLLGIASL